MSQSKWMSFIEAVVNTLIGLVIAFLLNALLMAAAGVPGLRNDDSEPVSSP